METVLLNLIVTIWIIIQIFLLWILADFITGLVHWWQDAYGNPNWPILGKYVVIPNLNHHKTPRSMLKDGYWDRVKTSVVTAIFLVTVFWFCGWHSWRMVLCLVFTTQGNHIHAMSHRTNKENGLFVMFLQKIGIFQGRKMHGWHHRAPYDTNFFILTNYLNPMFNKIKFFERLELLILKLFRIKPLRGAEVRGGV